ncbi:MAG: Mrp/NBP35 family ATP-binding protein [Candidatus Margulisiibacteriota bacterium]|nr:Mrp/NBP35 family ATP-binding protein [Candidatus Margulisiibacteriota bacterium]
MENIKHKIMVMSNKGGVGKSTIALNLAYGLGEVGKSVGVLDADLHGPNLPKMTGFQGERLESKENKILPIEVNPKLKLVSLALVFGLQDEPVIWRGPLKMKAIRQFVEDVEWGGLDYLIIDSPPGTGDEPLSVIQLIPGIDGVIIVTTPQEVAVLDSKKAVNFSRELKTPVLGIIENMSGFTCPHCGGEIDLFKRGGGEKVAQEMKVPFLGQIPLDPQIVVFGDNGNPFIKKESRAADAMKNIVRRIIAEGE